MWLGLSSPRTAEARKLETFIGGKRRPTCIFFSLPSFFSAEEDEGLTALNIAMRVARAEGCEPVLTWLPDAEAS
jgi:hypothetical protein